MITIKVAAFNTTIIQPTGFSSLAYLQVFCNPLELKILPKCIVFQTPFR